MERWSFLQSKTFWAIALGVTLLHGVVFYAAKDIVMFDRTGFMFAEWLPQTFWVTEREAVIEDGEVVREAEVIYTVPSDLKTVGGLERTHSPEVPRGMSTQPVGEGANMRLPRTF